MSHVIRLLLALLIGFWSGHVSAKQNLFIKIPSDIKYDFECRTNFKNSFGGIAPNPDSVSLVLAKGGNTDIFIANLNDIYVDSFYFGTKATVKAYIYKAMHQIITQAIQDKDEHPDQDFLVIINAVGGFAAGRWSSTNKWVNEIKLEDPVPLKIINKSDWHLEIKYTEEESAGTIRNEVKHLYIPQHTTGKHPISHMELADVRYLKKMSLQGQYAVFGRVVWGKTFDSAIVDLTNEITQKTAGLDTNQKTLAIFVNHVGHIKGGNWNVEVKVIDKAEGMANLVKQSP
jgi:hypothetical protein